MGAIASRHGGTLPNVTDNLRSSAARRRFAGDCPDNRKYSMEDLNMRDIINMEDLTDRADELSSSQNDDGVIENEDAAAEYEALAKLIAELEGLGGDHQWHGDWYPGYLIRDSYFESYMDEMLEDCGDLPKDLP